MAQAAGAVIGIGANLFGMYSQTQAMKQQKKAMKEQRNLQRAADERERRKMLREQAIVAGQTVNVAAQIGGLGGTGLTGGLSGLQNQVLSNMAFQQQTAMSVEKQQKFLNKAAGYQNMANIAEGIGSIGSGLMSTTFGQDFANGIGARLFPKMANPMQSYGMGYR